MRRIGPSHAPTNATATVPSSAGPSNGGNHSTPAAAPGAACVHSRATTGASADTQTTRKYCMNATSRMSDPNSPAMIVITDAAPGDSPQMATVPGRTR